MISEKTYFINGLPALYQALKKEGREKEIENILRTFLQ